MTLDGGSATPPTADVPAWVPRRRLRACVEAWPAADTGYYDPRCCRFPKSCSATVYSDEHVTEDDLEPARVLDHSGVAGEPEATTKGSVNAVTVPPTPTHVDTVSGPAAATPGAQTGASVTMTGFGGRTLEGKLLPSGVTGAVSELRACAYLMTLGYYVYRCESPAAPFDLVAYRDGVCLRVEVKSLSKSKDHLAPGFCAPRNLEWDLLLVVGPDKVFTFERSTSIEEARRQVRVHYGFPPSARTEIQPCGTPAAYSRHRDREEEPCEPCRLAMKAYDLARRRAVKSAS